MWVAARAVCARGSSVATSVYEPEIARTPATREQLDGHIAERVGERRRRLERHGDTLCDQGLKVRASVRWDYPFGEAVVRQVLRQRPDLLVLPAIQAGVGCRSRQ